MGEYFDAKTIPEGHRLDTDICIIGGGVAGITLAKEFIGEKFDVLLLESGEEALDKDTQSLYSGQNIGHPYEDLDNTRHRYFGGSSNAWKGWCRPLAEIDFEKRDCVPYSGWPFDRKYIESYYERAHDISKVEYTDYHPSAVGATEFLPLDNNSLKAELVYARPVRFGSEYKDQIKNAPNIKVYFNANVLSIETNETGDTVTHLSVSSLRKNKFTVSAKIILLATGGIENPRVLLLSDRVQKNGLGNQNDLVGRFFMEHLVFDASVLRTFPGVNCSQVENQVTSTDLIWRQNLFLTDDMLRRNNLLNVHFALNPVAERSEQFVKSIESKSFKSLSYIFQMLKEDKQVSRLFSHKKFAGHQLLPIFLDIIKGMGDILHVVSRLPFSNPQLDTMYWISNVLEQSPNPNSRVTLSRELDLLGNRKSQLDWQINSIDKESLKKTHVLLAQEFERCKLGKIQITIHDDDRWPIQMVGGDHHIGTTRMHNDPKQGVVDEHCQVHGVSNLFVAGSSVFPTGGSINPTLTIIALAVKLADHIKAKF